MLDFNYKLPEYPCKKDVWDILAEERRPILVYGMGNGADKLFRRFEKYGIKVSDVFASDGFVRGHSYRGYKVKSFSEVKNEYSDFVIVLSFASNRPEVVQMLAELDKNFDLYIPDMPVADEEEYFDREFFNANYSKIAEVFELLSDDVSRRIYAGVINYRLTGKLSFLLDSYSEKDEMYALLNKKDIKLFVDAGAYNGDTAAEAIKYFTDLKEIYAIEPDRRNYKKLLKFAEQSEVKIEAINAAVWNECDVAAFIGSGNRNSSVSSTASYQHREDEVSLITVDSLRLSSVDYIKYDVEGAEFEALEGSKQTIEKYKPSLLVSLYHRSRDVFFLPKLLSDRYPKYKLYIRRLYSVPAWELNLIMVLE